MKAGGQTRARVVTLIHFHPRLIRPLRDAIFQFSIVVCATCEFISSIQYFNTIKTSSIGNSMVSSAIWKKHARVSFSKTIKIA